VLVAIQDRRAILRHERPALDAASLQPLLAEVAAAVEGVTAEGAGEALNRAIDDRLPDLAALQADRAAILQRGVLLRLRDVLALWREIAALRRQLDSPATPEAPAAPAFSRYRDLALAAVGGLGAALAVLATALFWIASGWSHGTQAVLFAGITSSILAALDDPATAARAFLRMNLIGAGIAAIYVFALFPQITGFGSLVAVLLPFYLPFGMILALPQLGTATLPLVLGVTAVLGVNGGVRATSDLAAYLDTVMSLAFGIGAAVVMFWLLRPLGVGWAVRRLILGLRADAAAQAKDRRLEPREAFESRMYDRVNALFTRLDPAEPEQRSAMQGALACLRVGLNLRQLRRLRPRLPRELKPTVDGVVEALGDWLAAQGARSSPLPPLDAAIDRLLAVGPAPGVLETLTPLGGIRASLTQHAAFFALTERDQRATPDAARPRVPA
jgi:uncharacterized membrane protein YccC